jgi:formiminotetrahydrofolate cyclodeaminase
MENSLQDSVWRMTLTEFLEKTASNAPTPGGGSVTMVSASLGLGLVIMALEISLHKKASVEELQIIEDLLKNAREQLDSLTLHADKDVMAFQNYMNALSLPKQTAEQKLQRKQAMEQAILTATNVPLEAARDTLAAIALAIKAAEVAHLQVISDVGAGATLLGGAIAGVLFNVDINLPSISDPEIKQKFALSRTQLAEQSQAKVATILERVNQRIGKN